jgi:hypothetical protein
MEQTVTFNRLQVKALLLDTIMHIKHKQHLAPNYVNVKRQVCDFMGISHKCTSKVLLSALGVIYQRGGLYNEYAETRAKFGI